MVCCCVSVVSVFIQHVTFILLKMSKRHLLRAKMRSELNRNKTFLKSYYSLAVHILLCVDQNLLQPDRTGIIRNLPVLRNTRKWIPTLRIALTRHLSMLLLQKFLYVKAHRCTDARHNCAVPVTPERIQPYGKVHWLENHIITINLQIIYLPVAFKVDLSIVVSKFIDNMMIMIK